jgi:L-ascorbate metabolism protein UlaG (beta-lactamase superfamily)
MQIRRVFTVLVLVLFARAAGAQQRGIDFSKEPACQTLTSTAMGGPAPKNPNLVVMRYLGASNHEIDFRDSITLFNAYYQQVPPAHPLGFTRDDIKKANTILVGHAHSDHIADVPFVAEKTGAMVVGAPITAGQAKKMGLPDAQMKTVTGRGGELLKFNGFTVEPVLATHKENSPEYGKASGTAFRALTDAVHITRTPEQQAAAREAQGSNDPKIVTEGTIGYLFTFDNGFHIFLRDASGEATDYEKALAQRIGHANVAVISYTTAIPEAAIPLTMALVKLYKPDVYMPTHHDDTGGGRLDTPLEPLFLAIRDELPNTRSISPLYRTPVCIDIQSKNVFVGK